MNVKYHFENLHIINNLCSLKKKNKQEQTRTKEQTI